MSREQSAEEGRDPNEKEKQPLDGIRYEINEILTTMPEATKDSWFLKEHPMLQSRLTGITELLERLKNQLEDYEDTKNIVIDRCNLEDRVNNYTFNIAGIRRINANQFHPEIHKMIEGLERCSDRFFSYLSGVMSDPRNLEYVLTHYYASEEEEKEVEELKKEREREEKEKKAA